MGPDRCRRQLPRQAAAGTVAQRPSRISEAEGDARRARLGTRRLYTDTAGRPVDVRIAHGTGNDELDAAAIEAIRVSRFTGGARTGCLYPYWRSAGKLPAPERPAEEQMRPADAVCPAKVEWTTRPNNSYPPAYRKRAVEGWAIVSFDTAPWGEVGNVKVLDAQPSADFGSQAMNIIRSGRVTPSAQGASGCVETVKFIMPADDQAAEEDERPATD
ncbi:MAG: TonB family protein [Sphingomonadales bacterium]|nr:MAG: TonB family protein [Sphingomonadales bacterium]